MAQPLIVCDNLVKIYQTGEIEVLALQGLELTINKGEMVGIVGASGSGNTTLLNVLGGLVRPSAGQVIVNNHNLLKLSDRALNRYRRNEVGFVWQQGARNLIPYLTAVENVRFPMTIAGFLGKQARERANTLLEVEQFEELTVLDSAGRLQLPKAYRELLAIKDRVRLELVDDKVVISPVEKADTDGQIVNEEGGEETAVTPERGFARWLPWRRRQQGGDES